MRRSGLKSVMNAVALGTLSAPALAAPADPPVTLHRVFDILREGSPIGTNTLDFTRQGDTATVKVVTHILVKVMFVTAYKYDHVETATFKSSQLVSFNSTTDENGTNHSIDAHESAGKLSLTVDGEAAEAPKTIYPAIIFSPDINGKSLFFDPGNGKRLSAKSEDLGTETVAIHGTPQELRHIKLTGTFGRDLWFDHDGLVKMSMVGPDKSKIVSELRQTTAER